MAKAIWDGVILAESATYEMVEGNVYFPAESVKNEFLRESGTYYECPWKGHADYFDIVVGDKVNSDAVWTYPDPKPAASQIKGYFAFEPDQGISIEK